MADIKSTAIRAPTDDPANHTLVLRQLKETTEIAQRLRGDPMDSFVRVSELLATGLVRYTNGQIQPPLSNTSTSVPTTRSILTIDSITGGGDLSADRTLSLVNDTLTPGASKYYGTDGGGVRGWFALPGGGSGTPANPTALVGLTVVNGSATTYMRSDAAPPLDQSISPTWTGNHIYTPGAGVGIVANATAGNVSINAKNGVLAPAHAVDRQPAGDVVIPANASAWVAEYQQIAAGHTMTIGAGGELVVDTGLTGLLAVSSGGSGAGTLTGYLKGNGTAAFTAVATIPYSDISGTPAIPIGANPSALVGLAAVNGVAATFMRSDGAPALDQSIVPTWSGIHSWSAANNYFGSAAGNNATKAFNKALNITSVTDLDVIGLNLSVKEGTNNFRAAFFLDDANGLTGIDRSLSTGTLDFAIQRAGVDQFRITGTTSISTPLQFIVGDGTAAALSTINGLAATARALRFQTAASLRWDIRANVTAEGGANAGSNLDIINYDDTGVAIATALRIFRATGGINVPATVTGGDKGAGTINATGLFVAGVAVSTAVGANPTASVGLTVVNGVAATFMRSDAAPPIDQTIAPTWTAMHTFTKTAGAASNSYPILLSSALPGIGLTETDGGVDTTKWDIRINSGVLHGTIFTDAGTGARDWIAVTRTVAAISDLSFGNAIDNPTHTFLGTGAGTVSGIWTFGANPVINSASDSRLTLQLATVAQGILQATGTQMRFAAAGATTDLVLQANGSQRTKLAASTGQLTQGFGSAITAGGNKITGIWFSSTADFGIAVGSGVPTISAAQGSLYQRSDGADPMSRLYVNTDGATGWLGVISGDPVVERVAGRNIIVPANDSLIVDEYETIAAGNTLSVGAGGVVVIAGRSPPSAYFDPTMPLVNWTGQHTFFADINQAVIITSDTNASHPRLVIQTTGRSGNDQIAGLRVVNWDGAALSTCAQMLSGDVNHVNFPNNLFWGTNRVGSKIIFGLEGSAVANQILTLALTAITALTGVTAPVLAVDRNTAVSSTIPANGSVVVDSYYTVAAGQTLTIGAGGVLRILT